MGLHSSALMESPFQEPGQRERGIDEAMGTAEVKKYFDEYPTIAFDQELGYPREKKIENMILNFGKFYYSHARYTSFRT